MTTRPTAAAVAPEGPSSGAPLRRFRFDGRYTAPLLITAVLLAAQVSDRVLDSYYETLLAIGAALGAEIIFSLIVYKRFPHLASAYVSGISVGILIRSPLAWPYALCSLISIASKYVLRVKGRHIWNPSNFGIVAMLVLAPSAVATLSNQFGNSLYPTVIIWTLGSIILWRLKRLHISVTYVAAFFAFAALRAAFFRDPSQTFADAFPGEIAPITTAMYQLFIFFMITDPKSTVHPKWAQCLVAFLIAALECVLRLFHNIHAPYWALFIVGPLANLVEIRWNNSHKPQPAPAALKPA